MNDLMRPALYNANHQIVPVKKKKKNLKKFMNLLVLFVKVQINFQQLKNFQKLNEKDFIVICDVGAYGMSLSSNYNLRPKPIELLIKNQKLKLLVKDKNYKDLI